MPGAPTLTDLEATLDSILKPLRDQLAVIDNELAALDERKTELREVRSRINRLIGANSPTKKPGPKGKAAKANGGPSADKLDELETWLRKHVKGAEFTNPEIGQHKDWLGIGDQYTSHLLNALHQRGSTRLVRTGHPEYGNRTKIWRLTNA